MVQRLDQFVLKPLLIRDYEKRKVHLAFHGLLSKADIKEIEKHIDEVDQQEFEKNIVFNKGDDESPSPRLSGIHARKSLFGSHPKNLENYSLRPEGIPMVTLSSPGNISCKL